MLRLALKISISFILLSFSLIWMRDKLSILLHDKQHDFYELIEINTEEKNTVGEMKPFFINSIEILNRYEYYFINNNRINFSDLFVVKEFTLEKFTPPPEIV